VKSIPVPPVSLSQRFSHLKKKEPHLSKQGVQVFSLGPKTLVVALDPDLDRWAGLISPSTYSLGLLPRLVLTVMG